MRVLAAGIGNIFLGDDGFGVEVVRQLRARDPRPPGVDIVDTGIRGLHLAYHLLDGYDRLVLIDTVRRGASPGTVYQLEHDWGASADGSALDAHGMDPNSVLALLDDLATANGIERRPVEKVFVVGCEPAVLDEGIGLSAPVAAAVEPAVRAVDELLTACLHAHTGVM